jgi:hypothetical protein
MGSAALAMPISDIAFKGTDASFANLHATYGEFAILHCEMV